MVLPIQCTPIVTPGLKTPGKTPPRPPAPEISQTAHSQARVCPWYYVMLQHISEKLCAQIPCQSLATTLLSISGRLGWDSGLAVIDGFFFAANPGLSKFDRHPPAWHGVVPWEITKGWNSTKALQNFRDPQEFGVLVCIHWWHPCIVGV